MIVPNFMDIKVVNEKGEWTPEWKFIMQQLLTQLQQNFSNEGVVMPSQLDTNIAVLQTKAQNGTLVYDSKNNLAKVNINGTFKTITTS